MNVQQFAQSIRSKYPNGVASDGTPYADIPDEELTKRVVEKYPVYKDQLDDYSQDNPLKQFISGVKQSFTERKENISEQISKPVTQDEAIKTAVPLFNRRGLRVAGQGAAFIGDVEFEALKLIAPQFVEDIVSDVGGEIAKTKVAQEFAQKYTELKEKHPEAMQDIEDVINIAAIVPEIETIKGVSKTAQKTFGKVSKVTGDVIDARRAARIASASDEIDSVVGKIVQGKTKDISKAKKALSTIDTAGVETYSDLKGKIDDGIEALANKVDDKLDEFPEVLKPKDVVQTTKVGQTTVKQNFVKDALDQLEELYVKVKEPTSHARIAELKAKFETEGLTLREMNDLAREYGREFKAKAFTKLGEPTTSVVGQAFENTRKGIKKTVRDLMPDDVTKMLDQRMSEMYNTSRLVGKMEEKVNALYQKVQKRGILKRASMKLANVVDAATFGTVSGFLSRMLPSNVGLKVMNSIDLERALQKNLKRLEKLITTTDDDVLEKGVVDIVKKNISELPEETPKIVKSVQPPSVKGGKLSQASGIVAGFETDEDGNIRFNPLKAGLGVVGSTLLTRFSKKPLIDIPKKMSIKDSAGKFAGSISLNDFIDDTVRYAQDLAEQTGKNYSAKLAKVKDITPRINAAGIDRKAVEAAKKEMQRGIFRPIVLAEDMGTLDGAHRVIAAQELDIPILPAVVQK